MSSTSWLGGSDEFSLGPANAIWNTESGGDNLEVGDTDQFVLRYGVEKADLMSSQGGTRAQNKVQTADYCELDFGLAQAGLERMEAFQQGFRVKRNLSGVITGFAFSSGIGTRDLNIAKQLRLIAIKDGQNSTEDFDYIDIWKFAPMGSVEQTYNAGDQRFVQITGTGYKSTANPDEDGRATYFGAGEFAA